MPTTKETLAQVLTKLDPANDEQWTADGAPLISVVQKLANDSKITRDQINEAIPGFSRAGVPKVETTAEQDMHVTDTAPLKDAADDEFDPRIEPEVNGAGPALSEDEVRAILNRRIRDAEANLIAARAAASEANAEVVRCEHRLTRAHVDHNRQFPPITEAQNIKAHLASQGQLALKRAGLLDADGNPIAKVKQPANPTNPHMRSKANSRGWTRPPVDGLTGVQRGPSKAA